MKTEDLNYSKDYKYGFTTDVENIRSPKGLSEETIRFISNIKKEPKWMLEWRLKAFNRLKVLKEPDAKKFVAELSEINKSKELISSMNDKLKSLELTIKNHENVIAAKV